jgi:hypothetical protein
MALTEVTGATCRVRLFSLALPVVQAIRRCFFSNHSGLKYTAGFLGIGVG